MYIVPVLYIVHVLYVIHVLYIAGYCTSLYMYCMLYLHYTLHMYCTLLYMYGTLYPQRLLITCCARKLQDNSASAFPLFVGGKQHC